MNKKKTPLIIGNWKQNPATMKRAEKILVDIQKGLMNYTSNSIIVVAPPLAFLNSLQDLTGSQKIEFLAQDVSRYAEGAHTGEVSVAQLRSVGVKGAIVGHSERRADGETDDEINQKILALRQTKSVAILCVGERERDSYGDYFSLVEKQLQVGLAGLEVGDLKDVIIAYEPIWAIGTGINASPEEIEEMKLFIHKVLAGMFGREKGQIIKIIYGGSVTPDNAEDILKVAQVDGFLVGGASLEAKKFISIIKIADQYARMA